MLHELKAEMPYLCHHSKYQVGDAHTIVGIMAYNEFGAIVDYILIPSTNRIQVARYPAFASPRLRF
jgi:hypothetical protein